MSIVSLKMDFPGQLNVTPREGKLFTNNTMSQATSAGFINNYVKSLNIPIFSTDAITVAASDNTEKCKVVITNGLIQLVIM